MAGYFQGSPRISVGCLFNEVSDATFILVSREIWAGDRDVVEH
jgi:hypothetical protein